MDIVHFIATVALFIGISYFFFFFDSVVKDYRTKGKSVFLLLLSLLLLIGWWVDCTILDKATLTNIIVFISAIFLYIIGTMSALNDVRKYRLNP